MASAKIQFPTPAASPFTDGFGQIWIWNDEAWVRRGLEPGVEEAPKTEQQYARVHYYDKANPAFPGTDPETGQPEPEFIVLGADWELVQADEWYLGAKDTPPVLDNFGISLLEGHTYYDTVSHTMFVWDSIEWDAFSGVSEIATLWEFRWDSLGAQIAPYTLDALHSIDPADPSYPGAPAIGDDHGNIPFDQWIRGLIVVSLYKNGVRLVEKRALTPAYEDMPGRPSDEENEVPYATLDALMNSDPRDTTVSYIITTDGDKDIPTVGAGASKKGFSYVYDGLVYVNSGIEVTTYDYSVNYEDQTITFLTDIAADDIIVIETGTLAASQYIKSTNENASEWEFVVNDCAMGGESPSAGKLVTESAISCYVQAEIEKGLQKATQAFIGSVFPFAGESAPANALACNNNELTIAAYPLLFAAIGSTWNSWRGQTTTSGSFRLPPQHADGNPIFYGGVGGNNVGDYLPNTNKQHSHNAYHSHTGTAKNGGDHRHTLDRYNPSASNSKTTQTATYKSAVSGYTAYASWMGYSGAHTHTIDIDDANVETTVDGSGSAKPDTAVMLMCIWVDIQNVVPASPPTPEIPPTNPG